MQPPSRGAFGAEPEDLVEACRRGERAALQAVFRAHGPYLERLLARIVGPNADVEDLVQSTFAAAIVSFPRFRGEAQVRTWLARIAVRIAHDRLRRASHRKRASLPDPDAVGDESQDGRRAERAFDARRKLERLYEHLEAIGPKKRIAFVLHVIEGHSMEEVAALMDAARPATKSRVFWARRELIKRASRDPVLKELAAEAALREGVREGDSA
jgi:RNA polymerase sigma-70 factor (ECF subfamily)